MATRREINDRSRIWRPSSSQKTPGQRTLGVARSNARIRKSLRLRPERAARPESGFSGRSRAAGPFAGSFRRPRSPFLSLTADRPVNGPGG
jgi:hypothetical protein